VIEYHLPVNIECALCFSGNWWAFLSSTSRWLQLSH